MNGSVKIQNYGIMNEAMKSVVRCRLESKLFCWRSGLMLSCFLLWMSLQPDSRNHVSAVNLRRFIGCAVREFTFLARKPGCGSLHITTDACWGRCETWEKPVLEPPFIKSYQQVCTYNTTRLVTVKLPDCQPHVDPTYTHPVALRCDCGVCLTSTTECITSV
ncbi:glycoprotein hormone beta-5-like [Melanotaenia boesemani]|uniref:glycoprotein hormone beta-5-like n=1 Tax=Melanotaenia boesemani TaxID=1250792 RepID=UPI001C059009|nr:glycoprotein hormone beta-5-like [Melanotaenia boesemani]